MSYDLEFCAVCLSHVRTIRTHAPDLQIELRQNILPRGV